MINFASKLAKELKQPEQNIENVITLLDEGNTIPFIARYRKELHGGMDDTALRALEERLAYLRNLEKRKEEVLSSIEAQGKLTEELRQSIEEAEILSEVEDLYRPYKQKRRTRATVAAEKGLAPLAQLIFSDQRSAPDPMTAAEAYIDPENGVNTPEEALQGASDIIAEWISDDADIRKKLKALYQAQGQLISKSAEKEPDEEGVYRLYYDFTKPVSQLQGYQVLALNRGEREEKLKVSVWLEEKEAQIAINRSVVFPGTKVMSFVRAAAEDAWKRLIQPSVEREIRSELTEKANAGAIRAFGENLRPLLMQPPVKGRVVMGLDPGYRNGCKIAVVDATGKVLETTVVYPTFSERKKEEAIQTLTVLIRKHAVTVLAIGNGTASKETEIMAAEMIGRGLSDVKYMMVSEAGASVYSASKLAAEEFPDYDVNLRSAVSIARRLQDPLAELVKIDPKAIGVGQYQHDMPQQELSRTLDGVVEDCVNAVGVDLNTASGALLTRVSGLTAATAKNIVTYREENGAFHTRQELLKVPKLGPKAFKQCAGFLRISESKEPLDNTGVHPESYKAAKHLLEKFGLQKIAAGSEAMQVLRQQVLQYGEEKLAEELEIGIPTLEDIVQELLRPGRDPRDELPKPVLRAELLSAKDLKPGMELIGTVRNVVDFGAFVDIGVHQDGLVHISRLSERFIKHPSEVVSVGDIVTCWVVGVDASGRRISLSMRKDKLQ